MSSAARKDEQERVAIPAPPESGVRLSARPSDIVRAPRVTLIVYAWESVQPGTLAWVFPSLQAALSAAAAMKNATKWAIVLGVRTARTDIEHERASGCVLAEAT